MTPLAAFEDAFGRARRLLSLHDGLINLRQRRIRADWKRSFTDLMHWPRGAAIERVDSVDAVVVLRNGANLVPDDFSKESLDELLRAALALAVGALDRYVHERVTKGIVRALRSGQLTREQRDFALPATVALRIADRVRAARNAAAAIRPANEFRNAVQEEIHKRPFQGWRDIEKAFKLIGVAGLAGTLQVAYGVPNFSPIRDELNSITSRRNRIVHEGDLQVHQRAGGVRRNRIDHAEVTRSLDFIEDFVQKLEQV